MILSVVLPAYNEQTTIEQVILDHARELSGLSGHLDDWEILCLDDASTDGTLARLRALEQRVPRLRVLTHETNQGIFQSFDDLFAAARGTHIYLTASDGQWPAANLSKLLIEIARGADLAVGV